MAMAQKHKGGHKSLAGLTWKQVQSEFAFGAALDAAGLPVTHLVTIHPHDGALAFDDAACKRELSRKAANILQAIKGRAATPRQATVPASTTYEKTRGGALHCHIRPHVAPGNDALERSADGVIVHVRPAAPTDGYYVNKQRLPLSPEFEATAPVRRQASVPISGPRRSHNTDAVALMAAHAEAMQAQCYSTPAAPTADGLLTGNYQVAPVHLDPVIEALPAPPISAPVQLAMSFDVPPVPLLQLVEATRIERGLSQREAAAKLGMKQPGYSNAVVRRHDRLGPWAMRRALEFLSLAT